MLAELQAAAPTVLPLPGLSPAALYEAECDYVWNSLRRLGVPDADREDLTHEVFLTAIRRMSSYDPSRPVRPWLFGIAANLASRFRDLARHVREVPRDSLPDQRDEAAGPDEAVAVAQRQGLVLQALESVEVNRREVFILFEIDGYSMPEISDALGLVLNTAYSRLRLARREFTAAVQHLQGGQP